MQRTIIDAVIDEKAAFVLEIDHELEREELAELHGELRLERTAIIDGELRQLASESLRHWGPRLSNAEVLAIIDNAKGYWTAKARKAQVRHAAE